MTLRIKFIGMWLSDLFVALEVRMKMMNVVWSAFPCKGSEVPMFEVALNCNP